MAAAWGGEIIVSAGRCGLVGDTADDGVTLRDLGVHALRDIADREHLYQVMAPGLRAEFPPPRTESAATPTNLPTPLTRFVGRAREIERGDALVTEERLVTLIGPGGTGKTRLAIEVGRTSLDAFPDGVFFVALDAVRDPELVVPADRPDAGPRRGRIAADRRHRDGIPVGQAAAAHPRQPRTGHCCRAAHRRAGGARREFAVLGSSREPLGVAGERVYPVPALSLPSEPGSPTAAQVAAMESVQLFVERAKAARPDFALTDDNAPAVAAICRRVDGLPLAIELAAARANVLTRESDPRPARPPPDAAGRSRRDVTDRQRTLRGAIDWSHDLLSDDEKAAFRRFAVFAGGADLDATLAVLDPDAAAIAVDPIDLLGALVARSLLTSSRDSSEARFAMLETIREYALEQLETSGERAHICDLHAEHYAALANSARNVLTASDRGARLDALEREMPNFRAMIDWVIDSGRADLAAMIALGLKDFWRTRNHLAEACNLLDRMLREVPFGANEAARADVLAAASELASWRADYALARKWSSEQIEILERLGDNSRLSLAYSNVGWANIATEPEVARAAFARATEAALEAGDKPTLLASYQGLSLALVRLGQPEPARTAALAAIAVGDEIGDVSTNSFNLLTLGFLDLRVGDQASSARSFGRALAMAEDAGADVGVVTALDAVALLSLEAGDTVTAARLAFAAERTRAAIGGGPSLDLVGVGRLLDRAREQDLAVYQSVEAEVPALKRDEAIALARAKLAEVAGNGS